MIHAAYKPEITKFAIRKTEIVMISFSGLQIFVYPSERIPYHVSDSRIS